MRDSGLSLVEVMVAMGVFSIGVLSLLPVLSSSAASTFDNRARIVAANLAASDIDLARSTPYHSLAGETRTETVDGRSYRVVREVQAHLASGGSACITNGSAREREKRVSTRVETAFRGSTKAVRADTVVAAPVFDPASPRGAIGFQVLDRDGRPKQGLNVTVNGTTVPSDANGCAFFSNLPPGPYDVTVAWSGAVMIDGSTDLRRTVIVVEGQISTGNMRIDRAAAITVDSRVFGTAQPANFTLPTGLKVELATPTRTAASRVIAAQPVTGSPLLFRVFPEVGGYVAYYGTCIPSVPTASAPGTAPTVELPLSPVTVVFHTQNNAMNPSGSDRGVEVQWRSASGCLETLTYAVKTSNTCSGASQGDSASTCKLTVGVPAGDWRFRAAGTVFYKDATVAPKTASTVIVSW